MASVSNDHGGAVQAPGVPDGQAEAAAQGKAKRGGDTTIPKLLIDPSLNYEPLSYLIQGNCISNIFHL